MAELFETGRIADLIALLMLAEAAVLLLLSRVTGRGPSPAGIVASLGAGLALILALRAALVDANWTWIAAALAAAFMAHLADLALRYRA